MKTENAPMKKRRLPLILKLLLTMVILVIILLVLAAVYIKFFLKPPDMKIREDLPWQLTLVNANNPVPDNYKVELCMLPEGVEISELILSDYEEMINAAHEDGVYPYAVEGYRTREYQQEILDGKVGEYREKGYPYPLAYILARRVAAMPGTSEHELGLCLDFGAQPQLCTDWDVYAWLAENAYKYGFILRYPEEKTDITGITYEPWHYRYVGREAAAEIYESGECLEEYCADSH